MTMLTLTTGDTAPDMTGTVNADLTGATVEAHIAPPKGGAVITKPVTVTDAATGAWSFTWAAGDLAAVGTYYIEVQVTFSNGEIQTFAVSGASVASFKARAQIA